MTEPKANDLCSPKYIKELMDRFGIAPRREYGQNFLINSAIPRRIAESAHLGAGDGDCVLEIGPGIGVMTRELSKLFPGVAAVEIDRSLIPVLEYTLSDCANVDVVNADILDCDINALARERFGDADFHVCANLPYYITTPILMKLLEGDYPRLRTITVMVQSEVAARLAAPAGSREYGSITASVAYYGEIKRLFSVSPGSFLPAPKVSSAVIKLELYPRELRPVKPENEALMFRVIAAAFGQRRKTLVNALTAAFPALDKAAADTMLRLLSLDPLVRGEKLDIKQFAALSDYMLGLGIK